MRTSAGEVSSDEVAAVVPARRKWAFRLTAILLVPLLFLALLDLALRLVGYGYDTHFFQKIVIQGQDCYVENPKFTRLFFPAWLARLPAPFAMKVKKPAETFRIFVFGESAAEGDPRPQYSASRYLKALLQERFPRQRFEIINTAITAINSHVILPIARECASHDGDFWIIYMGNNEMVGPFGAATVFGGKATPVSLVRLSLALQRCRVGQLVAAIAGKLRSDPSRPSRWGGMEMFLQNEVLPGDRRREVVYENFRRNLGDILRLGTGSGAKIVLSTVAVNLKDCPPFGSQRPASLRDADRIAFEKCCAEGDAALQRRDFAFAAQRYEQAVQLFPQSADAHYQLAVCLLGMTNFTVAKQHFELARDYDTLPFRSDSRLDAVLQKAADQFAARGVVRCDAAGLLATNSPGGVPGQEYFYEHVHPNFDGNYELALAWAGAIAGFMPARAGDHAAPAWASQPECERLIGPTDWNRVSVLQEVIRRLQEPPLRSQSNNSNRVAVAGSQLTMLRDRIAATDRSAVRAIYVDALRRAPDDYMLHEAFAEFLDATGDGKEALAQRQIIARLVPQSYFAHLNLGIALKEQRQYLEAEIVLREAMRLNPYQAEVRLELGAACALQKKYELALRHFEYARKLAPGDPRPLLLAGEVLWKLNRGAESSALLHEAIRLKPDYVEAHYQLGEQLALAGDIQQATTEFQAVLQLKPDHLKARVNLGVAFARQGRLQDALAECEAALRIDPQNQQALQLRRQLVADQNRR